MKYPRQPLHSESWGSFDRLSAKRCHCEPVLTLERQSVSKTYKSCAFRRFLPEKITDSHTSDIGHWFGMTGAWVYRHAEKKDRLRRSFFL